MIYVYANSVQDALEFTYSTKLHTEHSTVVNSPTDTRIRWFEEGDEVYVLKSASKELKRVARVVFDRSWPKPHIFREMEVSK